MDASATGERKRILISDDEQDLVAATSMYLEAEGLEVRGAADVLEAVELARSWQPDLILTDIYKPYTASQLDGVELIKRLQADERTREIPVLVVSASCSSPPRRRETLEAGARAIVTKPFDPRVLRTVVVKMLGRRAAE